MVPVAKMKRNGEGKLVNDWQRVIGVILLLYVMVFDVYRNSIYCFHGMLS